MLLQTVIVCTNLITIIITSPLINFKALITVFLPHRRNLIFYTKDNTPGLFSIPLLTDGARVTVAAQSMDLGASQLAADGKSFISFTEALFLKIGVYYILFLQESDDVLIYSARFHTYLNLNMPLCVTYRQSSWPGSGLD